MSRLGLPIVVRTVMRSPWIPLTTAQPAYVTFGGILGIGSDRTATALDDGVAATGDGPTAVGPHAANATARHKTALCAITIHARLPVHVAATMSGRQSSQGSNPVRHSAGPCEEFLFGRRQSELARFTAQSPRGPRLLPCASGRDEEL